MRHHQIVRRILLRFCLSCMMFIFSGFVSAKPKSTVADGVTQDTLLINLSERLLYKVKTEQPSTEVELELVSIDIKRIIAGLNNDDAIKTFWINIYNAWFQILAIREKKKNPEIFIGKLIPIAGKKISLDDIEHGILRKYRWKYGMGYLPKLFPGKLIKQLAVKKIDYRIHFALNCGAKSCPPIAFYSYNNIDKQLNLATKSFLSGETEINDAKKELRVSKIMSWFIADFGGKKGIRKIIGVALRKELMGYRIQFKPYNWNEALHNFE